MGYGKTEQLCPHRPGKFRRWCKKATTRRRRREGKKDLDAPTKRRYYGYTD